MEMNEPELTDGLRRAKRQVESFYIWHQLINIYIFFWKISHAQQAAEGAPRNFNQRRPTKALYWAQ